MERLRQCGSTVMNEGVACQGIADYPIVLISLIKWFCGLLGLDELLLIMSEQAWLPQRVPERVKVVFISEGLQQLICLVHDGRSPSGCPCVLLILSHHHEMLIVRQSGSRRLFGLHAPYSQFCSLICAWVFQVLDFLTIHLRFFSSLTRKSNTLGMLLYAISVWPNSAAVRLRHSQMK